MGYGNALQNLIAPAGGAPPDDGGMGQPPAMHGVGLGAPPSMPGLPPAPTGVGAMPVGDPSTNRKAAADQAILALREAKGHFPAMGGAIDAMIDQLKSGTRASTPTPASAPQAGDPMPDAGVLDDSGSSGAA